MSCCASCDLRSELARLRHSALLRVGGYGVYRGLIEPMWIAGMLAEAMVGEQRADQVATGNDTEEVRGGQPARQIVCVEGGAVQDELFGSIPLQTLVADEVGLPVRPCGVRASYSIYAGPQAPSRHPPGRPGLRSRSGDLPTRQRSYRRRGRC